MIKKTTSRRGRLSVAVGTALLLSLTAACAPASESGSGAEGSGDLELWTHNAGNTDELAALNSIIDAWNEENPDSQISVQAFPQANYNDSVVAAASAGSLPCLVDIDGPNVPNWAWAGYLQPLDLETDLSTYLSSTQISWDGDLYGVGQYDVSLALFARKSVLEKYDIRIPGMDNPWTLDEFNSALATLKEAGEWDYPLDISTADNATEWYSYAYAPMLQSFGGDLIDRSTMLTADGYLNSDAAIEWGTWFQSLFDNGYVAKTSGTDGTLDFINGESAILYQGGWSASQISEELGDDMLILPPVDFGNGPAVGGASWVWGVTNTCSNSEAAMDFLDYLLEPENIVTTATAAKTIPASDAAAELMPEYQEGGDSEIFREFSSAYAILRPETPAYSFISTEFRQAALDIIAGADVTETLNNAVRNIDDNIESNNGYQAAD